MEELRFKTEVEVVISPQAQKILKQSKYTIDDFKDWALNGQQIALGGSNIMLFLEAMYNKEERENEKSL